MPWVRPGTTYTPSRRGEQPAWESSQAFEMPTAAFGETVSREFASSLTPVDEILSSACLEGLREGDESVVIGW
jgi:hypothetical protein